MGDGSFFSFVGVCFIRTRATPDQRSGVGSFHRRTALCTYRGSPGVWCQRWCQRPPFLAGACDATTGVDHRRSSPSHMPSGWCSAVDRALRVLSHRLLLLAAASGGQDQICDLLWVGDQGKVTCL